MRVANRHKCLVSQCWAGSDKPVRPTGLLKKKAAGRAAKNPESPLALSSHGLGVGRMDNSAESNPARFRSGDWAGKASDDVLESEPFGVQKVRWSKSVGEKIAHRTAVNRGFSEYAPIFTLFGPEVYETEPTELYVALEQLPLETASNDALRAYTFLREIVIADIVKEAHMAIHEAVDEY